MTRDGTRVSMKLKVVRSSLLALGLATAIWHLLPLVVWAARVEPELSRGPNASCLDVPTIEASAAVPEGWSELVHEGVAIRVPLLDSKQLSCDEGLGVCRRKLVGGNVGIHSQAPRESFEQMIDFRAPDQDDLSMFRSASANWRTIDALRTRVTTSRGKLDTWRYVSPTSKGIVAQTERSGYPRYVIAAYSPDGSKATMIGVSGLGREAVVQMFGSLRFVE